MAQPASVTIKKTPDPEDALPPEPAMECASFLRSVFLIQFVLPFCRPALELVEEDESSPLEAVQVDEDEDEDEEDETQLALQAIKELRRALCLVSC